METQQQTRRDLVGIGWMLTTGLCFVAVNAIVRGLGGALPAPQAAFIRFLFGLVFLAPVLWRLTRQGLPAGLLPLFAARGGLHTAAVIAWFFAMSRITVAEATAIGFLNPIAVTIGAALFLGERLAARRIAAIAVALLGALIVLRPGLRPLDPGHLSQIVAALCFGSSCLLAKRLAERAPASTVVAILSLSVAIGLAPLALVLWVPPSMAQLVALALVALFATLGHYCMARAFAAAPMTVTQPVTFLQLVWASITGSLLFGETLDVWIFVGGALMIGAISYITWREARMRRKAMTPTVNATKA